MMSATEEGTPSPSPSRLLEDRGRGLIKFQLFSGKGGGKVRHIWNILNTSEYTCRNGKLLTDFLF